MPDSPQQLTLILEKHHNHYLLSDYYLDHLLLRRPDWQEATNEARAAMGRFQTIYASFTPTENEAQTERDWIRPVLETLNHTFEVQPGIATPDGVRRPDYVFFPTEEARNAAKALQGQEDYPATALAVGDAKHWDRPLDQTLKAEGRKPRDPFTNKNPSWQIYFYMIHTGLAWGILTNGRLWRLYHKDTAHKLNYYYEVDLPALLGNGDVEAFKYFYLFFRQASFIPNGEGHTWLDIVLRESRDYAEGVSEDLKEQVYEALRHIAQGFLDYPGNNLPPMSSHRPDPDTLRAIYDNSLILLYRLLFILYAESRGLLPLQDNDTYRLSYSLDAIKKDIERTLGKPMLHTSRVYWVWLQELFSAINAGNEHMGVPVYNGDLFDPQKHPFLEQYAAGDHGLRQAVDLLARIDTDGERVFVDYRELEVRHLGSIYEGLLEYQLRYAEEDLAVVKERGRERYVPAGEGQEVAVPAGCVYLVTDRGERKATGSYYTPDYIVKYIVEQTLKPLLDETFARWAERKNVTEKDLVDDILSLDVLDPAMGSGHFLVEATEHIARYLVGLGLEVTAGMGAEAELDYWKRRVVQSCIYGVDLNPLAVELAKLSLWLATVSRDKPLSFLDHHLRCGNSLIGTRVADLGAAPVVKKRRKAEEEEAAGQISMFEDDAFRQSMMTAVDSMWLIEGTDSSTVEGVKEQERIYRELRGELTRRYRLLADLWTARHFGVIIEPEKQVAQAIEHFRAQQQGLKGVAETREVYPEEKQEKPVDPLTVYRFLADAIQNGLADRLPGHLGQMIEDARKIAEEKRFFHWELEFPEVFFDRFGRPLKEQAGFDVVVGNPPYVRPHKIDPIIKQYFWDVLSTFVAKSDIYVCFIEQGIRILKDGGVLSFITSDSWLYLDSFEEIRQFILDNCRVSTIADLPNGVFAEATVKTTIFILVKTRGQGDRNSNQIAIIQAANLEEVKILSRLQARIIPQSLFSNTYKRIFDLSLSPAIHTLKGKIASMGDPIACLTNISFGLKTGDDSVFLRASKQAAEDKPLLRGANIDRYKHEYAGEFVWYVPEKMRAHRVTARPGEPDRFESPKILVRDTLERLVATFDDAGYYVKDVLILRSDDDRYYLKYILAILNSALMRWFYETSFPTLHVQRDELANLPIRRIAFTTPQEERARLGEEGKGLAAETVSELATNRRMEGEEFVYSFAEFVDSPLGHWLDARLTTDPEQSDVVHDLLAHLAERMIEMNKQKQAEVRGFLDWLAGYTGLPVEDWTLKTSLKAYYDHDWTEMRRVLDRNSRKITKINVKGRDSDLIRDEWEASVGKLQPLLARIAATDRLIDLIVYQLYGLTEEEVAVVCDAWCRGSRP